MREYDKAKIYILKCRIPRYNKIYIGGTINLKNATTQHNRHSKNKTSARYEAELYNYIRDSGGMINWILELLIEYPCNDRKALDKEIIYQRNKNKEEQLKDGWEGVVDKVITQETITKFDKLAKEPTSYEPRTMEAFSKNWYNENRNHLNERVECGICDLKISRNNLKQHRKTKRCLNFNKLKIIK